MAKMGGADSQTPIHPSSLYLLLPLEDNRIKRNQKRKLEDYLDPYLLRAISSRICRTEKKIEKKDDFVNPIQRLEFDWPVDRLDPLINNPSRDSGKEYDGSRFFSPVNPSLSNRRRRGDFPMWKVNVNEHSAG